MDTARSDLEKHTLLKNREREPGEMVDGISDGASSTSTLLDNMDSEGKLNKLDIEEAPQAASASAQVAIRSNRARLTFWMVVNTLATIGIVSNSSQGNGPGIEQHHAKAGIPAPGLSMLTFVHSPGLRKQGHLRRPVLPTMSMHLRSFSFLRHHFHPLRPLPTLLWPLRTDAAANTNHDPPRRGHVPEHHYDEHLSGDIIHHILSDCSYPSNPGYCSLKFPLLPQNNPSQRRVESDPDVYWSGHHHLLRTQTRCRF